MLARAENWVPLRASTSKRKAELLSWGCRYTWDLKCHNPCQVLMAHNQHAWSPKTKQKTVWWFATFAPNSLLTQKLPGSVLYGTRKFLGTMLSSAWANLKAFCPILMNQRAHFSSLLYGSCINSYWTGICVIFAGGLPLPSVLKKDRATSGIFGSDPRNQQQIRGERKGTVNTI